MAGDGFHIFIPYRYVQLFVTVHFLHEHRRGIRVAVQREDLEYGVQQLRRAVTVRPEKYAAALPRYRSTGEVPVAYAYTVAVSHFAQHLEKLRGED